MLSNILLSKPKLPTMENHTLNTALVFLLVTLSFPVFSEPTPESMRLFDVQTNQKPCEIFHHYVTADSSMIEGFSSLPIKQQKQLKDFDGTKIGYLGVTLKNSQMVGVNWICGTDNKLGITGPISDNVLELTKQDIAAANLSLITLGQCGSKIEIIEFSFKRKGHCKNIVVDLKVKENRKIITYRESGQGELYRFVKMK